MFGRVTRHMLPHLPGIPHLHVKRPLENTTTKPGLCRLFFSCNTCMRERARAYAKIKNKKILQIDIFRKFYSNIAYLVWGLFYINSVWKTFAFLTFRWQKNNQDFCVYTCLLGHSWICVQSVRLSACKGATSSKVSIFENPLISPSLCVNQEGREGRVCHFDYSLCQIAVQSQRNFPLG